MENNGTLTVRLSKSENVTYLPGDTVAGSTFTGRCPNDSKNLVLLCGNHAGTCAVRFTRPASDVLKAIAADETVYCDGCTDHVAVEASRERRHENAMISRKRKTAKGVVLEAAIKLAGPKLRAEVSYVDLVLGAWRLDPVRFGLPGHEGEHPDSNRVKMELCSRRNGTLMDLYLERPRANVYRFTAEGRGRIEREQRRAEHERKTQTGGRV